MESGILDSLSVARDYGLSLRQKGSRFWVCCPLHREETPSLCFFPDGRWRCFGCGAHGDAADLYMALYGVSLAEALRICRGENHPPKPKLPTVADLRRKLEAWKAGKWTAACKELHAATASMVELEKRYTSDQLVNMDVFWAAAERLAVAKDVLTLLEAATPAQLLRMIAEVNTA